MYITRKSMISGKENTLEVPCTEEQIKAWQNGQHIQNAMPNVSEDLREFVMTGITPEEWNAIFGEA